MTDNFQRTGSISNAHVGRDFENLALGYFDTIGIELSLDVTVDVGINEHKKAHAFDLGCLKKKLVVECKSHKWTKGDNVPSAKLTVWNEAMYYFLAAPEDLRKILFVLRDFSAKRQETLAEYYIRTYYHLIPRDVEIWEYCNESKSVAQHTFNKGLNLTPGGAN